MGDDVDDFPEENRDRNYVLRTSDSFHFTEPYLLEMVK